MAVVFGTTLNEGWQALPNTGLTGELFRRYNIGNSLCCDNSLEEKNPSPYQLLEISL